MLATSDSVAGGVSPEAGITKWSAAASSIQRAYTRLRFHGGGNDDGGSGGSGSSGSSFPDLEFSRIIFSEIFFLQNLLPPILLSRILFLCWNQSTRMNFL
ncbi:unnamed protein product [Cuscuta epithymum]|uniref:Uncharacterized protein n=1 Tax=Cuscuta epithymum TaxID=186058 RepID=A0AAV0GIV9_9ASTE|nr:unnamed protein product [Cuscuta epithymum]